MYYLVGASITSDIIPSISEAKTRFLLTERRWNAPYCDRHRRFTVIEAYSRQTTYQW